MLSYEQVVEVTREEAREEILEMLDGIGFSATSWQEGSIPLGLTEIGAWIWSEASKIAVVLKKMAFNETSEDEALDRFSRSHYQNTKREAVPTRHLVTLTCDAGEGPHTINVEEFRAKNGSGYEFRNVEDDSDVPQYPAEYPATLLSGGSLQLILEADQPGEAANTEAGGITQVITTLSGVTMADVQVLRAGTNRENNASIRARNSLKWALLPALGIIDDSVEALARNASVAVDRVIVNSRNPRGAGTLDVYITAATGAVGTAEKSAVYDAIHQRIMHDPDGDALIVYDAPLQEMDITGTVYLRPGFDWSDSVEPAIQEALETFRRTIPLGGFSYPSPGSLVPVNEIETVIRKVQVGGLEPVLAVKLSAPAADVAVTSYAHVTQGTWSFTPIEVSS